MPHRGRPARRARSGTGDRFTSSLSRRSYLHRCSCSSWEEIWEAGPYYERVSELLEHARESVVLVGWQIDSRLPMRRPARPPARPLAGTETLRGKLRRLCEEKPGLRIYLLIWDHAFFYTLERERWQGRAWKGVHQRIHFVFDNRHPLGAAHHEKLCLVDHRIALCGGIDLCGDRWDSPRHLHHDPRRSFSGASEAHGPYHELAVEVTGPVCLELHRHVAGRWRRSSSVPFPRPGPSGDRENREDGENGEDGEDGEDEARGGHSVYLSRTLARGRGGSGARVRAVREVEFLYRDLIRLSRRRIILEGQYFWSVGLQDLLLTQMQRRRGTGFELVLILADLRDIRSLTRLMNPFELSLLQRLRDCAEATGTRLTLGNPYSHPPAGAGGRSRAVYVHSKVLIVDDRYLSIGSANFADRALRLDTEINLTLEGGTGEERAHIRRFSRQILEHWSLRDSWKGGSPLAGRHPGSPMPSLSLRQLGPELRLADYRGRTWLSALPAGRVTWVPWQRILDPGQPIAAPFRRRLARLSRRHSGALLLSLMLGSWLAASSAFLLACGGEGGEGRGGLAAIALTPRCLRWELLELALLSQAWILPLPCLAVAAYGGLVLASIAGPVRGAELAGRAAVASLGAASILGYGMARAYPAWMARLQRGPRSGRHSLRARRRPGERRFAALIELLFEPRLSLRSKIALQGLACVPLPWFLLGSLLILPALLYLGLKVWVVLAPRPVVELASRAAVPALVTTVACNLGKMCIEQNHASFKWKPAHFPFLDGRWSRAPHRK